MKINKLALRFNIIWKAIVGSAMIVGVDFQKGTIISIVPNQNVLIANCRFGIDMDLGNSTIVYGETIKQQIDNLRPMEKNPTTLPGLMVEMGMTKNKRDARRLIQQLGIGPKRA